MPAAIEDPASPTIFRVSGQPPFPDPACPALPADIVPRQVTLRDRQTVATIVPVASRHQLPSSLLLYLCDQINREIELGDTYPMTEAFTPEGFADHWFQNFGAVMLLGDIGSADAIADDQDWPRMCLGSFFIKPNYPGRSSHVCNGGLLVTGAARNRGAGRLMGESYIDWAPRLGYTYSVFNLVYETNVASCRIWDALGFKRIGRVKGCGSLRSHPDRLIDAIIYGRDLAPGGAGGDADDLVSEERFDKIKFYLKYGRYPNGADRAEKSRLRSAATHYKLLDGDKLMLKDKEVISDPARQYDIARDVHALQHGGINKTTATIAEKYHWSRIKETVSDVIRTCSECKDLGKAAPSQPSTAAMSGTKRASPGISSTAATATTSTTTTSSSSNNNTPRDAATTQAPSPQAHTTVSAAGRVLTLQPHNMLPSSISPADSYANPSDLSHGIPPSHTYQSNHHSQPQHHHHPHHHSATLLQDHGHDAYQPIDPQIINHGAHAGGGTGAVSGADHDHDMSFDSYHPHADFQALLSATEDVPGGQDGDVSAVDRDLEMLIEQHDVVDEEEDAAGEHHAKGESVGMHHHPSHADGEGRGVDNDASMDELEDVIDGRGTHRESSLYDVGFGGP
ncbi:Protein spt10 [Lecanicillium sp. MT-2017a]|nr:Protein spt10 [Lecanicillium sp. MT-2017a]